MKWPAALGFGTLSRKERGELLVQPCTRQRLMTKEKGARKEKQSLHNDLLKPR